jgi:hypothetical protein
MTAAVCYNLHNTLCARIATAVWRKKRDVICEVRGTRLLYVIPSCKTYPCQKTTSCVIRVMQYTIAEKDGSKCSQGNVTCAALWIIWFHACVMLASYNMFSKYATAGVCSRCDVIVRQRWVLWGRAGDAADRFRWPWGQGNLTYFLFTEEWKEKHAWHRGLAGCSQSYCAQLFTALWQLHVAPSGWTVKDCVLPTEWRSLISIFPFNKQRLFPKTALTVWSS